MKHHSKGKSKRRVRTKPSRRLSCPRCGGLLVPIEETQGPIGKLLTAIFGNGRFDVACKDCKRPEFSSTDKV